jgi:hypothetical protein
MSIDVDNGIHCDVEMLCPKGARSRDVKPARGNSTRLLRPTLILLLVLALILICKPPPLLAEDQAPQDFQVKAAFLVNFPKYVNWPTNTFAETNSPIVIAVFGDEQLADELQRMVKGKSVNGHELVSKRVTKKEECAQGCHILFISDSEQSQLPEILDQLKNASVLTAGESDDFLEKGGIINLATRNRKIRLQVNLTAANQARLKISSKLLAVADMVKGKPN